MRNSDYTLLYNIYEILTDEELKSQLQEFLIRMEKIKARNKETSNAYNKKNLEYHRITNNLYQAKRKNNIELINKYENLLKNFQN